MKNLIYLFTFMIVSVSCDNNIDSINLKEDSIGLTIYVSSDDRFDEVYVYPLELRALRGDEEYIFNSIESLNNWINENTIKGIECWEYTNKDYLEILEANRL